MPNLTDKEQKTWLASRCDKCPNPPESQCKARSKRCKKCGHRFPKEEYELWACPECSNHRHCHGRANKGMTVCKIHGGGSPKLGRLSGAPISHGRYSKFAPKALLDRIEVIKEAGDILNLVEDIEVARGLLAKYIENLANQGSPDLWAQAKEKMSLIDSTEGPERAAHLRDLFSIIRAGQPSDDPIVEKIVQLQNHLKNLIQAEIDRVVQARNVYTEGQLVLLMTRYGTVIREKCADPHIRREDIASAISEEFRRFVLPSGERSDRR